MSKQSHERKHQPCRLFIASCTSSRTRFRRQSSLPSQKQRLNCTSHSGLDESWWIRSNGVRFVRFLLSPPPEESMAEGRQLRERRAREVLPTDPKKEEKGFGAANGWNRQQLKMLGVTFAPNAKKRLDLNKVLNIDEKDWPSEVRQRKSPRLNGKED